MLFKRIAVVVPVFNRIEYTLKFIESFKRQTIQDFDIIICDDGSTDGTSEIISRKFPEIIIVNGNGDLWWTGGTNQAISYALQNKSKYSHILTINNDVEVENNFLEKFIFQINNNPANNIYGAVSVTNTSEREVCFCGCEPIKWGIAQMKQRKISFEMLTSAEHELTETSILIGRGTLFPVNVFEEIGLFNFSKLPHYMSDLEFSLRAAKQGYKLYIINKAIVYTEKNPPAFKNTKMFIKSLFNKKSPNQLKTRINFALLQCPKKLIIQYLIFDINRVVGSYIKYRLLNMRSQR